MVRDVGSSAGTEDWAKGRHHELSSSGRGPAVGGPEMESVVVKSSGGGHRVGTISKVVEHVGDVVGSGYEDGSREHTIQRCCERPKSMNDSIARAWDAETARMSNGKCLG